MMVLDDKPQASNRIGESTEMDKTNENLDGIKNINDKIIKTDRGSFNESGSSVGSLAQNWKRKKMEDELRWYEAKASSGAKSLRIGIIFFIVSLFIFLFINEVRYYIFDIFSYGDVIYDSINFLFGFIAILSILFVLWSYLSYRKLLTTLASLHEDYEKFTNDLMMNPDTIERDTKEKNDIERGAEERTSHYFEDLVTINLDNLREYYRLVKIHTDKSFDAARMAGIFGFILISAGLVFGFITEDNKIAYVATASGIIVEFISGIFFYLYNKTIFQLKEYHDSLLNVQNILLSFKLVQGLGSPEERDKTTNQMITFLVGGSDKK